MNSTQMLIVLGIWSVAMTILWVLSAAYQWAVARRAIGPDDLRDSAHKAHSRIDALHTRCTGVETRLQAMPTHADLIKVVEAVARIGGDVRNIQGQMNGINSGIMRLEKSIDTLTDHHIKEG